MMEDQSNTKSNRHTWHPDAPTHRRHPSYRTDVVNGGTLSSKPAVKRLFSNRFSSQTRDVEDGAETFQDAENVNLEDEASGSDAKRQRSGEWPLPNTKHFAPSRPPLRSRASLSNSPNRNYPRRSSSAQPHNVMVHQRTSSFMEGSMNDRVSAPPPASYIDYEDRMNQYELDQQQASSSAFARTDSGSFVPQPYGPDLSSTTAKTDNQKPPPMVRFGKNVFSAFNPTNWKLFSKSSKESKPEKDHGHIEISQQAYQVHKASNTFKTHTTQSSRFPPPPRMAQGSVSSPAQSTQRSQFTSEKPSQKRPSRVDSSSSLYEIPEPLTPKHEKRYGRVYESPTRDVSDTRESSPSSMSQASHMSEGHSPRKRSSFSFKKPSYGHHSASTSNLPLTNSQSSNTIPPKKEIVKREKIVKKISNLESQLEDLRSKLQTSIGQPQATTTMEQLNKTLNERPPVEFTDDPPRRSRRQLKRTTLATLPSERLLSGYVQSVEDGDKMYTGGAVFEEKVGAAFSGSEVDVYAPHLHPQSVAHTTRISSTSPRNSFKAELLELGVVEPAPPTEVLSTTQDSAILTSTKSEEADALHVGEEYDSDLSSMFESVVTNNTVIHHHRGTDSLEHGLAELEEVEESPTVESLTRKVSGKRKSSGDKWDDDYKPSKSSGQDAMNLRKSVPRQVAKKQKLSATDSPKATVEKKFDSPKGPFISSTKHPKRASVPTGTPPNAPFADNPMGNFVNGAKFAKRTSTSPPKDTMRKALNQFPAPPSSASFNFASVKQARPSTPGLTAAAKRPSSIPKRSNSPMPITSGAKMSIASGLEDDDDDIPPVPQISEEILKKHAATGRIKQKMLTHEDIQRQSQKAASNAGSSRANQDVARKSIENDGIAKPTKTHDEVKKAKDGQKGKDEDFSWDDDVF